MTASTNPPHSDRTDPSAALRALLAGNHRFVTGAGEAERTLAAAHRTASGQSPFALVMTCVDSRIPVETVFDQDFGDVCVIRTAGHVLDTSVTGSVELCVAQLGVSLVLVLGHERCGAVGYALDHQGVGGDLGYLADQIAPSIEDVDRETVDRPDPAERYDRVVRRHVTRTVSRLAELPTMRSGLADGTVGLFGARYDLTQARVQLLE